MGSNNNPVLYGFKFKTDYELGKFLPFLEFLKFELKYIEMEIIRGFG